MSEPVEITDTLIFRIILLFALSGAAFMLGGLLLGEGSIDVYAMYANLEEEPSTRAAIALGTLGGFLVVWGEFAKSLEIIASKFQFQVTVPRLVGVRKTIGGAFVGAIYAVFVAVVGALIYWKIMGRQVRAEIFVFASVFGAAVGFAVAFGKVFGDDSKVGEKRAMSYVRLALMGGAVGLAFFGFSGAMGSLVDPNMPQLSAEAFEAALLFVAVFGLVAVSEHAYKRKEFLPLVILYVAVPGALGGGIAAAVLAILLTLNGIDVSFSALMIVGATLGSSLGVWRRLGAMRNATRTEKVLGIVDFMATGRATGLAIGLAFIAAGVVFLWLAVPPFLTFARHQGGPFTLIVVAGGLGLAGYLIVVRGLLPAFLALRSPQLRSDTHGRARWATGAEMRRAGLMPNKEGIYLGQFIDDGVGIDTVGYPGPVHLITVGPSGSGKGTGLIIPNLATLRRSIFIIDPKGEAAAITARARAKFGPVKIINPFNVLADERPYLKSTGFNPLAALNPEDDNFSDDSVGIAQALFKEESQGDAAFFTGSADDLVTALIVHEKIRNGRRATLANVHDMLTEDYATDADGNPVGLLKTLLEMSQSRYAPLRSKGTRFIRDSRSTRDILQTARNELRYLDSPPLKRDLGGEAIDWNLMKREITTVYLILPADRLESHAGYLRLVVTSALRALLRSPPSRTLPPVLFMLDEFAQLGYLPPIENAMGIARGFGVQLWPFLQDFNQLHALYRDRWQTFLGQRGVLTAFAPQDMFTAEHLSKLAGQQTVIVESENERADASGMGRSRGPQGLPLIRSDDLIAMPAGQMLCLVGGIDEMKKPFLTKAPGYWKTTFDHGLDDNPYHPG